MDWDLLTESFPQIFERIIRHAAEVEQHVNSFIGWYPTGCVDIGENNRFMCIRKYSQVSRRWRRAILTSSSLFKPGAESTIRWVRSWERDSFFDFSPREEPFCSLLRSKVPLILMMGFLRVATVLDLDHLFKDDMHQVYCVLDITYPNGNKIEELKLSDIKIEHVFLNGEFLTQHAAIIRKCNMAHIFELNFSFWYSEKDAKDVWEILNEAIHCNDRPKEISIYIRLDSWRDHFGFTHSLTPTDGIGSIKTLKIRMNSEKRSTNWSSLGRIEEIWVNEGYFVNNIGQLVLAATKCVNVENWSMLDWEPIGNSPSQEDLRYEEMLIEDLPSLDDLRGWRKQILEWPTVTTKAIVINWKLHCRWHDGNKKTFTNTFCCDESLGEKVRNWLNDIDNNNNSVGLSHS